MKRVYSYQCLGSPDEVKEYLERRDFTKEAGKLGSCCQQGECSNQQFQRWNSSDDKLQSVTLEEVAGVGWARQVLERDSETKRLS